MVDRVRQELGLTPTGRPEKTPESIVAKLRRSSTKLSRMQDIAGCRLVVDNRPRQDEAVEALLGIFPGAKVVDRRKHPSHGYRAVHLVVGAEHRLVEIQVRTALQDRWANVVEHLGEEIGVDLKHGEDAPDSPWLPWLELGSWCLDRVEQYDDTASVADLDDMARSRYRTGMFTGVMLLVPYIGAQESGDE